MLKPSLKDARVRTRKEVLVKTNDYIIDNTSKEHLYSEADKIMAKESEVDLI